MPASATPPAVPQHGSPAGGAGNDTVNDTANDTAPSGLKRGLEQRHLTMIAIGGVIGAGLFVGSGKIIQDAGPGAFITYGITGLLIVLVMRMLGEMAVARPSTGSFADYARDALGDWAGFSVAWLYWYFWVMVAAFEAVAGAKVIQFWVPSAPIWLVGFLLLLAMTATNLFSVKGYGEFEYWFAMIKVAAIVVFLAVGLAYVAGLLGGGPHVANLTNHGGFFPHGVGAVIGGVVTVVFSMVGAEIATVAAAESVDPERAITAAVRSVVVRVVTFYVGSVLLLTCILPWNDPGLAASPFVSALTRIGLPGMDHVMNAVVLTAVLSCLNSSMYTASRMVFVLAANREAPAGLTGLNRHGAPAKAIWFCSGIGFVAVLCGYFWPDDVFIFLLNSSGAVILFVYLFIAVSQLILRRRAEPGSLRVPMWGFPYLTYLAIVAMLAILVQMAVTSDDTRAQLFLSLLSFAVVLAAGYVVHRRRGGPVTRADGPDDARVLQGKRDFTP